MSSMDTDLPGCPICRRVEVRSPASANAEARCPSHTPWMILKRWLELCTPRPRRSHPKEPFMCPACHSVTPMVAGDVIWVADVRNGPVPLWNCPFCGATRRVLEFEQVVDTDEI